MKITDAQLYEEGALEYTGYTAQGSPVDGEGNMQWKAGEDVFVYDGSFAAGKLGATKPGEKKCRLAFKKGAKGLAFMYKGEMKDNTREGQGVITILDPTLRAENGGNHDGMWKAGMKDGKGEGDHHKGDWKEDGPYLQSKDDIPDGEGFIYPGDVEGDGKFQLQKDAITYTKSGVTTTYKGQWDIRDGKIIFEDATGHAVLKHKTTEIETCSFTGIIAKNELVAGKMTIKTIDGKYGGIYKGYFKNGKRWTTPGDQGNVTIDGEVITRAEGEWHFADSPEHPESKHYKGHWEYDKPAGKGQLKNTKGGQGCHDQYCSEVDLDHEEDPRTKKIKFRHRSCLCPPCGCCSSLEILEHIPDTPENLFPFQELGEEYETVKRLSQLKEAEAAAREDAAATTQQKDEAPRSDVPIGDQKGGSLTAKEKMQEGVKQLGFRLKMPMKSAWPGVEQIAVGKGVGDVSGASKEGAASGEKNPLDGILRAQMRQKMTGKREPRSPRSSSTKRPSRSQSSGVGAPESVSPRSPGGTKRSSRTQSSGAGAPEPVSSGGTMSSSRAQSSGAGALQYEP